MNFVSVLKRTFQLEMKSTVHGQDLDRSLAPLLQRIYENGNNNLLYKSNQRDITVKKFALALLILTGTAGYKLLQKYLKDALPAYSMIKKMMGSKQRMMEKTLYFKELLTHLRESMSMSNWMTR